jgi:hypothetical protein
MYYVIKRNKNVPMSCFLGFKTPKYIATKNSENVIFEFIKDGKTQRKWVKKDEIVLLTEDKSFFLKTMKKFRNVQETQQKLVDEAQAQLNASMETFAETVNAELDEFEHIKDSTDVPCILKDL